MDTINLEGDHIGKAPLVEMERVDLSRGLRGQGRRACQQCRRVTWIGKGKM